ncbi:MAG: HAD-IA family hydrolase, partial [Rubrobacteridae bacterium]|nr:HAD-IA family hydrolase [Rubrobacteridae bacterium]
MYAYKAVLFDVDGTLLDTTEFIFQAFEHSLNKHGYSPRSRNEFSRLIGKPLNYNYSVLAPGSDIDLLSKTHREFQLGHIDLARTYPYTTETLKTLRSENLKIAAVTTRSRASTIETLKSCDILKLIDYVVALEDVVNVKPDPEPVLKALSYLDINPENAVMTGDSDADVFAGKNAGTKTIGVTYGFHGIRIADSKPDY